MNDKYKALRERFKEGDWVFGVGEHKGCSSVFDHNTASEARILSHLRVVFYYLKFSVILYEPR